MSGKDMSYGGNPLFNGHKPQPRETAPERDRQRDKPAPPALPDGYTIAVDFDGTLCVNRFPDIGEPKPLVIEYIKRQAAQGARIILYTCRENGTSRPLLDEALEFCAAHGIPLYAVNENPGNPFPAQFGTGAGRKMYADLYIDDRAANTADIEALMWGKRRTPERDRNGGDSP